MTWRCYMAEQDFFHAALANFMFDTASGGAIRHLADRGYTVEQIMKHLDFSTPYDQVQKTVWEHFLHTNILRLHEPGTAGVQETYEYVTEYDQYGRKSFRRVALMSEYEESILWNEEIFLSRAAGGLSSCLSKLCMENGEGSAYVSCDFGLRSRREPEDYKEMIKLLDKDDQQYILGLPWERRNIYHRLNQRMRNIVICLYEHGEFAGTCYFMDIKKKILLSPKTDEKILKYSSESS